MIHAGQSPGAARAAAVGALLFTTLASCVSVAFVREASLDPVRTDAVATLQPGESTLTECLAALGAPVYVWEHGDRAALGWAWRKRSEVGVEVSIPIGDQGGSASIAADKAGADTLGVVLFFDRDWRLVERREGLLRDLASAAMRTRPAVDESDLGPAGGGEVDRPDGDG